MMQVQEKHTKVILYAYQNGDMDKKTELELATNTPV